MTETPDGDADRVEGSILFTDLVGFTAYNEAAGDAAAVDVLDRQSVIVDNILSTAECARVVKELGDGLMIWFNSAAQGLDRAVALLDAVSLARKDDGFPLAIRMGIHHGEALARGDDLVGHDVNVASRVSALAGPGELLISENLVDACGAALDKVSLRPVGPTSVKGVSTPIWLYRLAC